MWRLVKEGVRFYRPVLLVSWAFGVGILVLILILLAIFGSAQERSALLTVAVQIPFPILIASVVAGFIAGGTERGESRVRLQVMLPLRVGEIALARVLLPTVVMLIGLVLAHVLFAVMLAVEGSSPLSPRHLNVDFIAVQLLFWLQLPLAIREIIEFRRRARWTDSLVPKAVLVVAGALVILSHSWPVGRMGLRVALVGVLVVVVMALTSTLFRRRTSFTK